MQAQLLKDGLVYQENGLYLKYYNESQFEKYRTSANIIGSVYLKPENVINETERVSIPLLDGNICYLKLRQINPNEQTFGYLYVGAMDFIKIAVENIQKEKKASKEKLINPKKKSKMPTIIVIVLAIIVCIGIGLFLFLPKKENDLENNSNIPSTEITIPNISNETTEIPLYTSFNLNKDDCKINLSNPKENTVDFIYEIYQDEIKLFTTNKITPGNQETIDMSKYLSSGEYNLIFKIRCFDGESEMNGTEEPVKVVLK